METKKNFSAGSARSMHSRSGAAPDYTIVEYTYQ